MQVKVHAVPLDMRDTVAVARAHEELPAAFKPVHFLVNNAGLALGTAAGHEATDDVRRLAAAMPCVTQWGRASFVRTVVRSA